MSSAITTLEHSDMAPESSFTGFGDTYIDTVAPEWDMGLYLPHLSAFEGDPLSRGIFRPPLPPQLPPYPTNGFDTFSSEMLLDTTSALGAMQDIFLFNQAPHEASAFQPQTTTTSPYTTASYNEVAAAEVWHTDPTHSSSSVLPIFSLPAPSLSPVTTFPPNWIRVPQRNYRSKQWNFKRLNPISFSVDGRPGVNMGEALRKACADLDGWDDPVLMDAAGAISCRLLFPGYPANSSSCQIHVLDWTRNRLPITRSKLAHEVAKKLERYLDDMANYTMNGSVEGRWEVGEGFMHIDNMFLVRLESVSKGSFQPEIWVADS